MQTVVVYFVAFKQLYKYTIVFHTLLPSPNIQITYTAHFFRPKRETHCHFPYLFEIILHKFIRSIL